MTNEKPKYVPKKAVAACDSCIHFVYDEEYGDYACEVDLDEDEMSSFLRDEKFACPYYRPGDEYLIVRKQM